jgi:hypothetical protein
MVIVSGTSHDLKLTSDCDCLVEFVFFQNAANFLVGGCGSLLGGRFLLDNFVAIGFLQTDEG